MKSDSATTLGKAAAVLLLAVIAAACGKSSGEASTPASSLLHIGTPIAAADDPCGLLEPKEVEAVLGATLAVPPYRSEGGRAKAQGTPVQDGPDCRYETADFHGIHVAVSRSGGPALLAGIRKFAGIVKQGSQRAIVLSKGTTLDGSWDDAQVTGCCDFLAVLGDRGVDIDVSASNATLEQASALAEAALKRLDHPLMIDGNASIALANAHTQQRPQLGMACSLLARTAIEAIIGPLSADPISQQNYCELHTASGVYFWKIENAYGGYAGLRNLVAQLKPLTTAPAMAGDGPAAAFLNNLNQGVQQKHIADPAWSDAVVSIQGLRAVKRDVQIAFGPTMSAPQTAVATRLAAAVMGGL